MKTIFYTMILISSIFLFTAFQNGKNAPVQEAEINAQNPIGSGISNINEDKWKLMQAMQSENNFSVASSRDVNNQISICGDQVYSGVAVPGSIFNAADDWDFYVFSGNAGDVVTIRVERTGNCYMDPAFSLYFGTTNSTAGLTPINGGTDMTWLQYRDDNFVVCPSCFSDPELVNYVLPSSGTYTLAVYDVFNCAPGGNGLEPLTYDLTITGVSCGIPTMGEWGLIILALLMLQGIWLTLVFKPQNAIIEVPKIWFQGMKQGLQDKGLMLWFAVIAVVAISLLSLTITIQTADFFGVPLALMVVLPAVYIYKSHMRGVQISA